MAIDQTARCMVEDESITTRRCEVIRRNYDSAVIDNRISPREDFTSRGGKVALVGQFEAIGSRDRKIVADGIVPHLIKRIPLPVQIVAKSPVIDLWIMMAMPVVAASTKPRCQFRIRLCRN
ncbi:hypothetical protein ACI5KX_12510 [Erythrobacter sp. GH1-10]|uniref:hypothetical protein n=1 Tax=Erythrobacter sp. GH1-10 TaxID=3349334 RepID=UPI003877E37D